jgi:hypothetical protein
MAVWKKVVASGSNATLAQVTASGLRIESIATDDNSTLPRVIVENAGNLRAVTQSDVQGEDTTYSSAYTSTGLLGTPVAGQGFSLAFSFDYSNNYHDNFRTATTGSTQFTKDHIDWTTDQGGTYVLNTNTYDNKIYTAHADDRVKINSLGNLSGLSWPVAEITSSPVQAWTTLDALEEGAIGNGSANPANFQIETYNPISAAIITSPIISASTLNQTLPGFGVGLSNSAWSASTVNSPTSADWDVNPNNVAGGGLELEGIFYWDGLEFNESLIDSHTGSHVWGSPTNFGVNGIDTQTTFIGDSEVVYGGVTASGTFYGDGSALTGIPGSAYDIEPLTTGSGITSSALPNTYDYLTANTFKLELDGAGITSGLKFLNGELLVAPEGVTPDMVQDATVLAVDLIGDDSNTGEITKTHLAHSLIESGSSGAESLGIASGNLTNNDDFMVTDLSNPTAKKSLANLNQYIFNELTGSYTNAGGSVTGISVAPLVGGTLINGLYLQLDSADDATTSGVGTIETITLKGTAAIGQSQWVTTAGQQLSVANGGTGATGANDLEAANAAATSLLSTISQTGNSLRIGGTSAGEATTISGSIQVNTNLTAIKSDHFETKDLHVLLGNGDFGAFTTYGLNFGRPATSSNSIIFDDTTNDDRLKFGYGYGINAAEPQGGEGGADGAGVSKYSMMGVCSGSTDEPGVSQAELEGNMRIHEGEIYLYV